MAASTHLRVGTRESILARLQTDIVVERLRLEFPEVELEIVPITTHGDKVQGKPIAELGTRGVFIKELERALLDGEVDFVVHSLKDLPTDLPQNLCLAAVLNRADARDVLVAQAGMTIEKLPSGSRVGTSSRRRMAQLAAVRSDLNFVDMRGNIQTRLRKFDEGECDAMVLAAAGLLRLKLDERISQYLDIDVSTPAAGQGALAVESRSGDIGLLKFLKRLEDSAVRSEIEAERALLDELGGGCSVPIGAFATTPADGVVQLVACVAALDGSNVMRACDQGASANAVALGKRVANHLRERGAEQILVALRQSTPNSISAP